jgi:hypothetical protein
VKILIFQLTVGIQMQRTLPCRDDGVYALLRTNGEFGDILRQDPLDLDSRFAVRVSRDENAGTAPAGISASSYRYCRKIGSFPNHE